MVNIPFALQAAEILSAPDWSMVHGLISFLTALVHSRRLIFEFALRDFRLRYLGSSLGLLWAIIQPIVTVLIFWFVFSVGFKAPPIDDFPFVLWLICGMVPWFFIAEILATGTGSVVESSYLVKKVVFRVSMLPIVKLLSGLGIHSFFIGLTLVMFILHGIVPDLYALQCFYYTFACGTLLLGFTWLTSALNVFYKDIHQLITMFLQFGFWLTPIFWSINFVPAQYRIYLKLNPFYYIVQGYRDSLIHRVWFWEHPLYTLYFWSLTGVVLVAGALVFTRLRPHFADVM